MNLNTRAQYFVAQNTMKYASEGGRLILMSSIVTYARSVRNHAIYSASKASVEAFVRCLSGGKYPPPPHFASFLSRSQPRDHGSERDKLPSRLLVFEFILMLGLGEQISVSRRLPSMVSHPAPSSRRCLPRIQSTMSHRVHRRTPSRSKRRLQGGRRWAASALLRMLARLSPGWPATTPTGSMV